jgi:hypothetical protein
MGSDYKVPHIFNFGIKWRQVSFMLKLFFPREGDPGSHWIGEAE